LPRDQIIIADGSPLDGLVERGFTLADAGVKSHRPALTIDGATARPDGFFAQPGAGPECDGQILVLHDILNLTFAPSAKFVRQYADAAALIRDAVERYREDVEHRAFPTDEESYHLPTAVREAVEATELRAASGIRQVGIRQV